MKEISINGEEEWKLRHGYKMKNKTKITVIIEVKPNLYKRIADEKYQIYVRHQRCKVFED